MFQIKSESLLLISLTSVQSRENSFTTKGKKIDQKGATHNNSKAESNTAFSKGYSSSMGR